MNLLQAIKKAKALLSSVKLTQEPLLDNSLIQYDTDQITEGEVVYLCDGSNDWSVLPDGQYETKSGIKFVVTDGLVTSVDTSGYKAPEAQKNPLPQAIDQAKKKPNDPLADDSLDDDNPGENDKDPKADDKDSSKGKGAIDLDEDMSEDAKDADGKPKYGDVEYADPGLQEDKKKRYPIDTEEHIRAAWNYINKEKNKDQYSPENKKKVEGKIIAAWKKKIDPAGPPSAQKTDKMSLTQKFHKAIRDLQLAVSAIAPPGAGAPANLLDPNPDTELDTELARMKTDHALLAEQHHALRGDHEKLATEHAALATKCDEMAKDHKEKMDDYATKLKDLKDCYGDLKKASDDHQLALDEMSKESKSSGEKLSAVKTLLETVASQPAAKPAEEVITHVKAHKVDADIKGSKAWQVLVGSNA
jgi:hypothetical protein